MKTRNILAFLLLLVAGVQTAAAQGFRVYKSDGTVAQFSFRTDSIVFYDGIGSDVDFGPFTPVNQCIVGTWYKTKSETITFNEDGTTNYLAGATYEFLPYQGTLIINNAEGKLTKLLRVPKVTKDYIVLSEWGGETFAFLTAEQPGQLVTGITINPASLNLQLNETTAITATVLPADADNKEVEWTSSDEAVAVVGDFFGTITVMAKGYGTCTITATAKDGSSVKGECQVKVAQLVTGITISPATLTLEVGKTQTLTANIQPSDATNKAVTWTSSNTSIATVSTSGKVTAKAAGISTITATAKDGSGVKAGCQLTVVQPVTSITISPATLTLEPGKTQTLTTTIQPSDATEKSVTWTSSKSEVATVSTSGEITAVAPGECTITATAKDGSGVKGECQVTVAQLVTGITLNKTALTLFVGSAQTLTATIQPTEAADKSIVWSSSKTSVATVDQTGKVTAKAVGTCVITATVEGSEVKAECTITVVKPVTGISLSPASLTLFVDSVQTITATIQPSDATNKTVTWKSSNTSIATVSTSGKVTAVAQGECTITATAKDGSGVKAECQITVVQPVTSIKLSPATLTLFVGSAQTLTAAIQPSDATNKTVTWTSSNKSIATVSTSGKVTAVAPGKCTITATAKDGSGVKGTCKVTVEHEWVDLGLPSRTLWATYNVGASKPEEYGDYFAWGETEPKSYYNLNTYKFCNGSDHTMTKYCTNSIYGYEGFTDDLTVLQPEDDAATANWGSNWQMPSNDQFEELSNSSYTTIVKTQVNGVNGIKITSKINGVSIFLPAAGYRGSSGSDGVNGSGNYWSSSLYDYQAYCARKIHFLLIETNWPVSIYYDNRYCGLSVRPVRVP